MKITILLTCLLFLPHIIVGQEATIKGKITSFGIPVNGVTVTVTSDKGTKYSTTTNSRGEYDMTVAEYGEYRFVVIRHNVIVYSTTVAAAHSGVTREFELPGIIEIVNVATGEAQAVEQVSKTVDVIDAQQMRDRADFSLVESLRTIPGFRLQQLGGFGRTANIKTRGLRNSDTAVLIDGIRFRDATAITGDASPFLSDITLTSVNKIEVLRGSGSSLYGTNAIGGVVDFQTPTARSGTHGQIGGAFGGLGFGRFRGNISHGAENNKFGITAGVSRTEYRKGVDGNDDANNTNFQTRIDANPFSKTSISSRIFVSDADVRLNSGPDTAGALPTSNTTIISAIPNVTFVPDINDPDNIQRSKVFSGQFVVNQIINSKLVINGYYQGLRTKRTNDNGPLGIGFQSASTSVFDGTIHTGNAHLNWTPNRINQFTAGYEFEREKFGNDGRTPSGAGNFFTRAGQQSHTFYVQDLVSLLDGNLQFAGGVRVQKYSLDRPAFSLLNAPYSDLTLNDPPTAYTFDGAASYFIRKSGTKLRVHVGNGYRVPSLYERFGSFFSSFGTPSFVIIGDPFLKPEKTVAFDAGIEQNLANDRVRLSGTYFWTRLNDIINYADVVPDIGLDPRPFGGYENQRGGNSRGGEFSMKARASDSTDIFASYTFTDSVQRIPQAQFSGILKTLGVPDHQFTFVATQRFKRAWVNFDFLATSTYLAPIFDTNNFNFQTYVYRFKGNRKGDLTAGYTFGFKQEKMTLRLYGTVENVFDQEYYENGFRTAGATGRAGLSFGF
ncbi:MAG: TonB-dependent receptor domain-containing protein [Pyrinomonadaceae bacterium]